MKKLYILRGHPGSGKSTQAQKFLNEFKANYPHAKLFHFENDKTLIEMQGDYIWTPENVEEAKKKMWRDYNHTLKTLKKTDACIVVSNVFARPNEIKCFAEVAQKHDFEVEVYRSLNWFDNLHNVTQKRVIEIFMQLEQNPYPNQKFLPIVKPAKKEIQEIIEQLKRFDKVKLEFDNKKQTYVTNDYLKLGFFLNHFTKRQSQNYPDLYVLKYHSSAFFNNTWNEALLEMRGLVLDKDNNIVIRPFKKIFNYSERIAKNAYQPISVQDDEKVIAVKKVNGFLGCATYVKNQNLDQVIYSTTGSLDSDFAKMVASHLKDVKAFKDYPNHTFMFEICDKADPHIIEEEEGATFIGLNRVSDGYSFSETELDELAKQYGLKRPETIELTFGELKQELKDCKHEGFMVHIKETGDKFKMKSTFYLTAKFFGRSTYKNLASKLNKQNADEDVYPIIDHIKTNLKAFEKMNEQERVKFVRDFLNPRT